MPYKDPIVEEIHEIRQKILARYGNDIHAYLEDCRRRDAEDDRPVVSYPPRHPEGWSPDAAEKPTTPADRTRGELLDALSKLSQIRPEWRLGQTLANLAATAGRTEAGGVWELKDEEALAAARVLIEQHSEVGSEVA